MDEWLPSVAVVIPTRCRADLLANTLPILLADPATAEVIVAHDGDDPATCRLLEAAGEPRVRRVQVPARPAELPSGQFGREAGADAAGADVLLVLDDDVVPSAGLVTGHARRHSAGHGLVVVGRATVRQEGLPIRLRPAARFYSAQYEATLAAYRADPSKILANLWGGHLSVARAAWLAARRTPTVNAGYHADRELGLRLAAAGLRGVFDDALAADHRYRRTLRSLQADAAGASRGHAALRQAYGVDPPTPSRHSAVRLLARATRGSLAFGLVAAGLRAAAVVASAAGLRRLEDGATKVLWRLAFTRALPL
jgi:hypothetical protein